MNLGIQRQITNRVGLEIRYVGNHDVKNFQESMAILTSCVGAERIPELASAGVTHAPIRPSRGGFQGTGLPLATISSKPRGLCELQL